MVRFQNPVVKYHLVHLGCRVNAAEMETLSRDLDAGGWVASTLHEADVAVVNTCTVTRRADSKSLYAIRRAASRARHVFVTGCFSELERSAALAIPGVTAVIPQSDKGNAAGLIRAALGAHVPIATVGDSMDERSVDDSASDATPQSDDFAEGARDEDFRSHARAILKVQDGCNAFCAYCRIPHARGLPRSIPSGEIIARVHELSASGAPECVLTGINLGLWREDGKRLCDLLGWILEAAGPMYVRLSSLEPRSFEMGVAKHYGHPRLVPHLHFPLQGGCDGLLTRMNRRYDTATYRGYLRGLKEIKPDLSISTDVICGFPGETEAEFEDSLEFYASCGFSKVHVFPFSARPLTAAERMPGQVAGATIHARCERLKASAAVWEATYRKSISPIAQRFVLETEPKGGFAEGTTDRYQKGRIPVPPASRLRRGASVMVRVPAEGDLFENLTKDA